MSFDEQPRRKKYTTSIHLSPKKLSILYERYKAREISLSQLSQMTGWCARQASRNYKKYITTGESIVIRGYGSHLPFTTEQCYKVLKLAWEGNNPKQIAAELDVPLKKIKRPLMILSYPTMNYAIIQYENTNLYSFIIGIKMSVIKDDEIYLHMLYNKESNCIVAKNIHHGEKLKLDNDGMNKEEYKLLINKLLNNMSEDYYQSFKMRRMLDRENNDERLIEYMVYYQKHINKLDNSEICVIIKQLIDNTKITNLPLYSCCDSKFSPNTLNFVQSLYFELLKNGYKNEELNTIFNIENVNIPVNKETFPLITLFYYTILNQPKDIPIPKVL